MTQTLAAQAVALHSVNVGMPAHLGRHIGRPVDSGFHKTPVQTSTVFVGVEDIVGDAQADLTVHGGPEKAVYAYSRDHNAEWLAEIPAIAGIGPAYFGENLTVSGWLETDVRIGDVWSWGDARIQVCQPRWPCFKLALASGLPVLGKVMLEHGWTGWYFRVLQTGIAPVDGPIVVTERGDPSVTVFDAHLAMWPDAPRDLVERVIAAPALASRWRANLRNSLANRD